LQNSSDLKQFSTGEAMAVVALAICLIFAPLSRAIVSLGTGLFGLSLIIQISEKNLRKDVWSNPVIATICAFIGLIALSTLLPRNKFDFSSLIIAIPLVVIPLATSKLDIRSDWIRNSVLLALAVFAGFALTSSINYLIDPETVNQNLLQSKHVPLTTKMHHIYFGLYLAVLAWVGAYYWRNSSHRIIKICFGLLTILLVICLHILSSRTGLIAFYSSIAMFLFQIFIGKGSHKSKLIILMIVVLVPTISVLTVPSIQYKIRNTQEDLTALLKGGEEVNYKSMAMRVEAWRASWTAIQSNWLIGVGDHNFNSAMDKAYEDNQSALIAENRITPHNQFLESWMRNGILAFLILCSLFITPLFMRNFRSNSWFWPVWILFLTSFMVESVLQRQMGIILFSIGYFFFIHTESKKVASS